MDLCFPTNVSDFKTIASKEYTFVDKTLMIKDIVSFKNGPFLFTRPRRFGKTLNLSMLHCFFDMDHPENRDLFEGLNPNTRMSCRTSGSTRSCTSTSPCSNPQIWKISKLAFGG